MEKRFNKSQRQYSDKYSRKEFDELDKKSIIFGRNSVMELLKTERDVDKVFVKKGVREGSITLIVSTCISKKIPVLEVDTQKLDQMSSHGNHQGVVAIASLKEYVSVDDILNIAKEKDEVPFILICDDIEDPHNLGAMIRCAECAGVHGIIIPKRHSVGITSTVYKASAGAIEHIAICKVTNISMAIEELKEKGLWIYSCEANGEPYYDIQFDRPCAIVMGSEGNGVSRIIKDKSDYIVSIPMYGKVNSLNVSTASSVILCHAARTLKNMK